MLNIILNTLDPTRHHQEDLRALSDSHMQAMMKGAGTRDQKIL
jgi:hypothetical protein